MRLLLPAVMFAFAVYWSGAGVSAQNAPAARVSNPVLIKEVKPEHTPEARAAKIEGDVHLGVAVLSDGTVGDVTITKSLDTKFGLDAAAVSAVKQWVFEPGKKDGKPVPVRVSVVVAFALKE